MDCRSKVRGVILRQEETSKRVQLYVLVVTPYTCVENVERQGERGDSTAGEDLVIVRSVYVLVVKMNFFRECVEARWKR